MVIKNMNADLSNFSVNSFFSPLIKILYRQDDADIILIEFS